MTYNKLILKNYFLTNQFFFLSKTWNKKVAIKISNIYFDDFLNDNIYILNSGLLRSSFLRKKQLIPSVFQYEVPKVHTHKKLISRLNYFTLYPISQHKNKIINLRKKEYLYQNFYHQKWNYWNENFFEFNNRWFISKINQKITFLKTYLLKKKIRGDWKYLYYMGFNGSFFRVSRRYKRLLTRFSLFRKNVKPTLRRYLRCITGFFRLISRGNFYKYTPNQWLIYSFYLNYLFFKLFNLFKKIKKINKKGPFALYYLPFKQGLTWLDFSYKIFLLRKQKKIKSKMFLKLLDNFKKMPMYYKYDYWNKLKVNKEWFLLTKSLATLIYHKKTFLLQYNEKLFLKLFFDKKRNKKLQLISNQRHAGCYNLLLNSFYKNNVSYVDLINQHVTDSIKLIKNK